MIVSIASVDEVLAVAEATMRRVARNADLLADRLDARGWKPLPLRSAELRTEPSAADAAIFNQIEELSGAPVPPALLAFWKVVGGINFVWDYKSGETPAGLDVARRTQPLPIRFPINTRR